jgi:small-conductance mechanosensitive channel
LQENIMGRIDATLPVWMAATALIALAVLSGLAVYWLALNLARRWAARTVTTLDDRAIEHFRKPALWLVVAMALTVVEPGLALGTNASATWYQATGLLLPALLGWLAVAGLGLVSDAIKDGADITVADNLRARQRRTRAEILYRVGVFVVLLITFCMMLMSIPAVRNVGVTLAASAGLAALAVGAAAQPALKNLIAGLQMAFTEPIRLDDVVIIDGEWGRIEEIRLTYVVVKIWDERRLIVPVSKFLEDSFQNWTRQTSQLLGSVFWYLDPATDVARLRSKLNEVVRANDKWDGRFCNLQVTDTKPEAIELRALMSARDASIAFDLRCDVREAMLAYIRTEMPDAIIRYRGVVEFQPPSSTQPGAVALD